MRTIALCLASGSFVGALLAELALRAAGTYSTYSERNFGEYREVFGRSLPTWVHAWDPRSTFEFETAEFHFTYAVNSDGVRDVEHALEPEPGRRRIVVLGDSFAEGVGVERHEAWPAVLGELLERGGTPVEVFNAGVSASDPFFEYQLLRERILRYAPDLVVVGLNQSDQEDTLWWGGMERFRSDGSTQGRALPWSMRLYRRSHLARLVLHRLCGLSSQTLCFGEPQRLSWEAQTTLVAAIEAMAALRRERPFELLVLTHPVPYQVAHRDSGYYRGFHERVAALGVVSTDLSESLHAELGGLAPADYAWPVDGHFNARGYAAFARAVERVLIERGFARASAPATGVPAPR